MITGFILLFASFIILERKRKRIIHEEIRPAASLPDPETTNQAKSVGKFYNDHNDAFLKIYGEVIQAFRTKDVSKILNYQANAMGLTPGMKLLDAGCGICGPAIHFAKNYMVDVDAVTVSEKQASVAKDKIKAAGVTKQVTVYTEDYHYLESSFQKDSYDVVYFLESFGHSDNKPKAIDAAWQLLKPGGMLYIKDLFAKEINIPALAQSIKDNISKINDSYCYNVANLCDVITWLRRKGFILSHLKTIDIPLEDFENLTISNEFQTLTGINRIDNLQEYVFPVDFFELSCIKPWYDPGVGSSRYFLQNLYHMQILHRSQNQL